MIDIPVDYAELGWLLVTVARISIRVAQLTIGLISNPCFLSARFYDPGQYSKVLLPVVYLGGGIAVWLFAREVYHIGASGLAFGMLFFVFTIGAIRWERRTIALSLVVFFLYGGMIWGVLLVARDVSFESHLSGALIGIVLAILLRRRDPEPPRKQYSWEREETEADDLDWLDRL